MDISVRESSYRLFKCQMSKVKVLLEAFLKDVFFDVGGFQVHLIIYMYISIYMFI